MNNKPQAQSQAPRHVERQATRMREMIARANVDAREFVRRDAGQSYASAREQCLTCGNTRACLTWLDYQQGSDFQSFCPNAPLFNSCLSTPPHDWQI